MLLGLSTSTQLLSNFFNSSSIALTLTSMQFCAESGLLLVGHTNGEVRAYQFSPAACEVTTYEATSRSHKKLRPEEESGRHVLPANYTCLKEVLVKR